MDYRVKRYKGGKSEPVEIWSNYSLKVIREQARQWIERREADRVHVRDNAGKLVLRYPSSRPPPRTRRPPTIPRELTPVMQAKQKVSPKIVKLMAATAVLTFATLMLGYRLLF